MTVFRPDKANPLLAKAFLEADVAQFRLALNTGGDPNMHIDGESLFEAALHRGQSGFALDLVHSGRFKAAPLLARGINPLRLALEARSHYAVTYGVTSGLMAAVEEISDALAGLFPDPLDGVLTPVEMREVVKLRDHVLLRRVLEVLSPSSLRPLWAEGGLGHELLAQSQAVEAARCSEILLCSRAEWAARAASPPRISVQRATPPLHSTPPHLPKAFPIHAPGMTQ